MKVFLAGRVEVERDGVSIDEARFPGRQGRLVFAYLMAEQGRPVPRDELAEAVWGEAPPATWEKALSVIVSKLRGVLAEAGVDGGIALTSAFGCYRLELTESWVDVIVATSAAREAEAALAAGDSQTAKDAAMLSASLLRRPFLPGEEGAWVDDKRREFADVRCRALAALSDASLRSGDAPEAVKWAEQTIALAPFREAGYRRLMDAHVAAGNRAEALRVYEECRRLLADELGTYPSPETESIYRGLLEAPPAPAQAEAVRAVSAPGSTAPAADRRRTAVVLTRSALELVAAEPPAAGAVQRAPSLHRRSSSFIGRTRELREIRGLLHREEVRLLTLTGAGGSGKTRLALEVTNSLEGEPAGAVLVELGRVTDARFVARALAGELGVKERSGQTARQAVLEYLRDRRTLLLLDNFEHVLAAAALLEELLDAAPGVRLLVTSRAPLGLPEEHVYRVPALELPDPSRRASIARLRRTEAIRLFVDRARAARPDFELTDTNAESVVEVCVRLDGLPLALELAAARCHVLSPRALRERLDSSLDLLRAAPGSGLTERQWTLRGAIEWSYELLDPEQQQLFTSLGVFVGGFTLGGAELIADQPRLDTLEGVESLLRNNLLITEHGRGDEPRLGMLETIREYALERLTARGDGEAVRRRHADFYLLLAEAAEPGLLGPQQREWLDRLDAERDNIRAALTWAAQSREGEVGLRIGAALWRFWQLRSYVQEGRERLEELLALGSGSTAARATAQTMFANLTLLQGDYETAGRLLEESLIVHRRDGDAHMVAYALGLLGMAASTAGEIDSALALTREALEVARGAPSPYMESAALWHLGVCLAARGELDDAERTIEEAVDLARKLGNARSVGGALKSLGGLALMRGDHEQARRLFDESLAIHRSLNDAWGVSNSLANLAFLALEAGDAETARVLLSEALAIERDIGDHPVLANALEIAARLAAGDGHAALSIRLYARATLLRELGGGRREYELGLPDATSHIADLRSRVDEATFEAEWERGRAMSLLEAIDQASGVDGELKAAHAPHTPKRGTASPS